MKPPPILAGIIQDEEVSTAASEPAPPPTKSSKAKPQRPTVASLRAIAKAALEAPMAKGQPPEIIALMLAIACVETGNREAALLLEYRHKLRRFGFDVTADSM